MPLLPGLPVRSGPAVPVARARPREGPGARPCVVPGPRAPWLHRCRRAKSARACWGPSAFLWKMASALQLHYLDEVAGFAVMLHGVLTGYRNTIH